VFLGAPQEERYRAFVESCSEAYFCIDFVEPIPVGLTEERQIELAYQYGFVSDANRAMAEMHGYADACQIIGAKLEQLVPKAILHHLRSFIRGGYRATDVESKEDRNGTTKYFVNNLAGVCESDRLVRVWGIQRDITDRKQLEDQLRKSHRLEAVGRVAGEVAHDFNDVLSVILTASSLLELEAPGELREDIAMIREAALRAVDLTKQLRAVGQGQIIRVRVLDLGAILIRMERMLRRLVGDQVEMSIDVAPDLWPILGDSQPLEQVILNLVVTACDAMSMIGTVRIEARNVELASGHQVMLSVSHTGAGSDEVGLDVVGGMVRRIRGTVEIERGAGTTFKIYFPRER